MNSANIPFFVDRPRFLAALQSAPDCFEMRASKEGTLVPVGMTGDQWLGSRYDPIKDAARWIESQNILSSDLPVFVGWSPHHLFACKQRPVVIVEKDASLVKAILNGMDLSDVLDGVTVILDSAGHDTISAVRNIFDPFRHARVRVLAGPWVRDDEWLKLIHTAALNIQREIGLNALSFAYQLPIWIRSARRNLEAWAQSPRGDALYGALKGETAIIVAAGPSLDRNIEDLKQVKGRAVIIAVDTVLRRLDAAGIVPDIVVAVDANAANAKDVYGLGNEILKSILVADHIAAPEIVNAFSGPRIFLRSINYSMDVEGRPMPLMMPLDDLLMTISGQSTMPCWQSGGSVSTNAFFLTFLLGIRRVIFVGQDLAYTDRRAHTSGVGYEDETYALMTRFRSREMQGSESVSNGEIVVEGWDGRLLQTSVVLREYLRWYENTIADGFAKDFDLIDATEGGARKKGMRPMTLAAAIETLGAEATHPGAKLRACLEVAPAAVVPGWEERLSEIRRTVQRLLDSNLPIDDPLAKWIALPAYMGTLDVHHPDRERFIEGSVREAARFITKAL